MSKHDINFSDDHDENIEGVIALDVRSKTEDQGKPGDSDSPLNSADSNGKAASEGFFEHQVLETLLQHVCDDLRKRVEDCKASADSTLCALRESKVIKASGGLRLEGLLPLKKQLNSLNSITTEVGTTPMRYQ